MKKLIPLMCIILLAACSGDDWGHCTSKKWGYCEMNCCHHKREALSERSLGSMRGVHNIPLQYNDRDYKGRHEKCDHMNKGGEKKGKKRSKASAAPVEPVTAKEQPRRGMFF